MLLLFFSSPLLSLFFVSSFSLSFRFSSLLIFPSYLPVEETGEGNRERSGEKRREEKDERERRKKREREKKRKKRDKRKREREERKIGESLSSSSLLSVFSFASLFSLARLSLSTSTPFSSLSSPYRESERVVPRQLWSAITLALCFFKIGLLLLPRVTFLSDSLVSFTKAFNERRRV